MPLLHHHYNRYYRLNQIARLMLGLSIQHASNQVTGQGWRPCVLFHPMHLTKKLARWISTDKYGVFKWQSTQTLSYDSVSHYSLLLNHYDNAMPNTPVNMEGKSSNGAAEVRGTSTADLTSNENNVAYRIGNCKMEG
ncbi:hypothetical protein Tco_1281697 [Tanacetum coccineum]